MNWFAVNMDQTWSSVLRNIPNITVRSYQSLTAALETVAENRELHKTTDVILLAQDVGPEVPLWELFYTLRQSFETATVVMLVKDCSDPVFLSQLQRLAGQYRVHAVIEELSKEEIYLYLNRFLQKPSEDVLDAQRNSLAPVITCWGTSPRVGVTTVVLSSAKTLAQKSNLKVAVLDLNFRAPDVREYLEAGTKAKDFGFVQADLSSKMLTGTALKRTMLTTKSQPNLFHLLAPNRRDYAGLVSKEEVNELLFLARSTFDVIFVDVNSYPDNAATLRSLKAATERWVITEPSATAFHTSWRDWFDHVFRVYGFALTDFKLIVNKTKTTGISQNLIATSMGLELMGGMPYVEPTEDKLGGLAIGDFLSNAVWKSSMDAVINKVAERNRMELFPDEKEKGFLDQVKYKFKVIRGAL